MGVIVMEIRPRETVILASDFSKLVDWYRDVLGFKVVKRFEEAYHYCNLETSSGIRIGIASAEEMGVKPLDRAVNTVVLQFEVDDLKEFFSGLKAAGGVVTFGPNFDKKDEFWFGGFSDLEGNPFWVVDKNCP
jgi:predicted enzyme related to lactoylglutathione lyase